ncbi:MAG TPA: hypothetical protein VEP67_13235 [Thiobacillaceae bacterium]|nr:hypothetical protein [Thiobacillaceae bacterium]
MSALDHKHLISCNCRDGYRSGPIPALLVSALLSALICAFPDRGHAASFEPPNPFLIQPRAGLPDAGDRGGKHAPAGQIEPVQLHVAEMAGAVQTATVLKEL